MIWAQLLVVLLFIYLGARLGGIGIGFMGGMGVVALSLLGLKPGAIPFDVISVIMSVIMAIAAMQVAGGMDFLVKMAEKILRKNPKYITFLAPTVTYFMTVLAGTGHTAFSTLPVIAEVAKDLKNDEIYQDRLAKGLITMRGEMQIEIKPYAKRSVAIFLIAILVVMLYATAISKTVGLIQNPILSRDNAIISFMLSTAAIITMACKVDTAKITNAATFKSGMSAVICVLGVAWLGNTFVEGHIDQIKAVSAEFLQQYPWSLAVILFFASTLLYSQAATAKALYPTAILLGVSPEAAIAAFAAVSALFILPTYPTLIAAVEMDDTGSTRIGKYVFNHPFLVPGVIAISLSVLFGFLMAGAVL